MDKDSNINLNINNVNSSETNDTKTADIISTEHIDNTAVSENAQEKLKAELNKRLLELDNLKKELDKRELELDKREQKVSEKEENLKTDLRNADVRISESDEKMASAVQEQKKAQYLMQMAEKKSSELINLEDSLALRETAVRKAEIDLNEKLAAMRREFETEQLELKNSTICDLEEKRSETHKKCEELLNETLQKCSQIRANAEEQMSEWRKKQTEELEAKLADERAAHIASTENRISEINTKLHEIENERIALAQEYEALKNAKNSLDNDKLDLAFESKRLQAVEKKLSEQLDKLNDSAHKKAIEIAGNISKENEALEEQCNLLRNEIGELKSKLESYKSLERTIGDEHPAGIQKTLLDNKVLIQELKNQLANAPSPDIEKENKTLKEKFNEIYEVKQQLETRVSELMISLKNSSALEAEIRLKEQTIINLNKLLEHRQNEIGSLNEEIKRLSSTAMQTAERNDRLRAMFNLKSQQYPFDAQAYQQTNEIEWLSTICQNCEKIDMVFPKRIIYAFHTALKIADWSTVTVLAGVSGTGKSELPRLYSEFGGINFINVPVQPNWDSQEAMLGYFNSIDNRFDAQPLLQFLVQCTESFDNDDMKELLDDLSQKGYKQMNEYMSIVLLDEMNLAHVELYFADFLSKLESRRGKAKKYVPNIEVKLGAGIPPYELKLSRNVLWTGTMNQDETTKSLSDKVLDRGIIINFPRPSVLKERNELVSIDLAKKNANIPPLSINTWTSWQVLKLSFEGEQYKELMKFKEIVEQINKYLSVVGRAVGHRVWQSIEYYIANYPDVIKEMKKADKGVLTGELKNAMHIAFEDQIVQKIMPKLRGIETRGISRTQCLDPIKALLEDPKCKFNLSADFDQACNLGYGQFIWCSANYIDDGQSVGSDQV